MADDGDNDNGNPEIGPAPPVSLDKHRGLRAQKEIERRRMRTHIRADQDELRKTRASLEEHLFARPAATWSEAADKCRYILGLFATTGEAQDPRYKLLISGALEDLARLQADEAKPQP